MVKNKMTRREALSTVGKIAITAVISGVVAGVGGYMIGSAGAPKGVVTKTETITKTVTAEKTITSPTTAVVTPKGKVIVAQHLSPQDIAKMVIPTLKPFEEKTGIKVENKTLYIGDLNKMLPTLLKAGTTPADILYVDYYQVIRMIEADYLYPLDGVINPDDYIPAAIEPVIKNGHVWATPLPLRGWIGYWYKPSFFKKHDLKVPTNRDEFFTLFEKIKKHEKEWGLIAPIAIGDGWTMAEFIKHVILNYGYKIGRPKLVYEVCSGKVKWNSDVVKDALKWYLIPMLEKGYFSEPSDWVKQLFVFRDEEKYAVAWQGCWVTQNIGWVNGKFYSDLDVFCYPEDKALEVNIGYYVVPKSAPNLEAALEVIKFLGSAEYQAGLIKNKFAAMYSVKGGDPSVYDYDPGIKLYMKFLEKYKLEWAPLIAEPPGFFDALSTYGLQLFTKPETLEDVLDALDAEMSKLLKG